MSQSASTEIAREQWEGALNALQDGNERFVRGELRHPHQSPSWREQVAKAQNPFAAILTCADSRVAPEIIFDQGIGDLYVVREAGNVVDDVVLGTLEFAVQSLDVGLIVVMGHEGCAAIEAALTGTEVPEHVSIIVGLLEPAIVQAQASDGDSYHTAISANALLQADRLRERSAILGEAERGGRLHIIAGRYELESGRFSLL